VTYRPWDGTVEQSVDLAIQDTRTAIYPLHGLEPPLVTVCLAEDYLELRSASGLGCQRSR
jgi:hypothetical protein